MDGYVTIGTSLDTKGFDAQIKEVENKLDLLEKEYAVLKKQNPFDKVGLQQYEVEIEKTKNKLISLQKQQEKLSNSTSNIPSLANVTKAIEKNTSSTIRQIGKWALAVFSVRTAYQMVQRASSTLAQYDKQYSADLQYIQYVLSQAIAPALKYIVNLAYSLMYYIRYIANAWFGVNLFSKASAKNFSSMSSSAKTIRKELAGFDEMNVLGDNTSSSGVGGVMPSMDMSAMNHDVPKWLKWLADNRDIVLGVISGISAGLVGIKVGLGFIKGLGIGLIIYGVINLVKDLINCLKEPTWTNFGKVIQDIGIILIGFGVIIGGIPAIVLGVITLIVGYVIKNWDTIKGTLSKGWEWLKEVIDNIGIKCEQLGEKIRAVFTNAFNVVKTLVTNTRDWFNSSADTIRDKWGILGEMIVNHFVNKFETLKSKISWFVTLFIEEFDGIKRGVSDIFNGILDIFQNGFWDGMAGIAKGIANMLIGVINGAISKINKMNIEIPDWVPNVGGRKFGFDIPKINYLATGGIINRPGKGIPIGGEAGAEGIIPLTDSQAMEQLGEAIGKYITINANITNKMNGRVLSRELQKVQNQSNFAFNS